jgi:hypothetical protein
MTNVISSAVVHLCWLGVSACAAVCARDSGGAEA